MSPTVFCGILTVFYKSYGRMLGSAYKSLAEQSIEAGMSFTDSATKHKLKTKKKRGNTRTGLQ